MSSAGDGGEPSRERASGSPAHAREAREDGLPLPRQLGRARPEPAHLVEEAARLGLRSCQRGLASRSNSPLEIGAALSNGRDGVVDSRPGGAAARSARARSRRAVRVRRCGGAGSGRGRRAGARGTVGRRRGARRSETAAGGSARLASLDLDRVCSFQYQATVLNDNTVRLAGKVIDIPPGPGRRSYGTVLNELDRVITPAFISYSGSK